MSSSRSRGSTGGSYSSPALCIVGLMDWTSSRYPIKSRDTAASTPFARSRTSFLASPGPLCSRSTGFLLMALSLYPLREPALHLSSSLLTTSCSGVNTAFLSESNQIFALRMAPPLGWSATTDAITYHLHVLRSQIHKTTRTRRGPFDTCAGGFSFGGGQVRPTVFQNRQDDRESVLNFLNTPEFANLLSFTCGMSDLS